MSRVYTVLWDATSVLLPFRNTSPNTLYQTRCIKVKVLKNIRVNTKSRNVLFLYLIICYFLLWASTYSLTYVSWRHCNYYSKHSLVLCSKITGELSPTAAVQITVRGGLIHDRFTFSECAMRPTSLLLWENWKIRCLFFVHTRSISDIPFLVQSKQQEENGCCCQQ